MVAMQTLLLVTLVAACATLAYAGCDLAVLPYSGICSGNGECINNTCVCHEDFNGLSEFFEHPECVTASHLVSWFSTLQARNANHGCFTYKPARKAMLALHTLLPIFPLALGIFRLIQLRPLTCCRVHVKETFGYAQIQELFIISVLVEQYGILVNGAILLFEDTTIHRNPFAMVFGMLAEWVVTINLAILSFMFVHLCLSGLKMQIRHVRKILRSMKTVLICTTIIMCIVVSVAEMGSSLSYGKPNAFELGQAFGRLYAFTICAVCLVFLFTMLGFAQALLSALREHMKNSESLAKESAEGIKMAASRLRRLQIFGVVMMVFATSVGIIVGVLPALQAYYRSLLALNLATGQFLLLVVLRPPKDRSAIAPTTSL